MRLRRPRPQRRPGTGEVVGAAFEPAGARAARLSVVGGRTRLVLAGGDTGARSAIREEIALSDPAALVFEADDVWGLLQLAPRAGVVILAGDLQDAPASALLRLLRHRHPDLNVISPAATATDPATAR